MVARQYVSEIESNEQQTKLKPRSKICLLNNRVIAVTAVSEDKSQVNKYNHERGEMYTLQHMYSTAPLERRTKEFVYKNNRLNDATPICHEYINFVQHCFSASG